MSLPSARGEAVGLLGPNGAGKTTVFYMITGLIAADQGTICLDGEDITRLPMYQRARLGIGYLPQETSIFRGITVEDNIRAVLELPSPTARRAKVSCVSCSMSFRSNICGIRPLLRYLAASAGGWRSPGRWPPGPRSCFSTSPSPASIPLPSAISASWCAS